jgi:two-component system alkaline phosphatase synthesis response regulator PhoP
MEKNKNEIKILIIEDEKPLLELLTVKLSNEGYQVETAEDGEEGYAKIKSWTPDLILLDIIMPKMDGYDVLEKLSQDAIKIPVIVISNSGQMVEIEKTKKLGAVDHLIKTEFSPEDVLKKVNSYLESTESGAPIVPKTSFSAKQDDNAQKLGIRVLLVEDDTFLREICSKKLTKEGFTVYEAVDGQQALDGAIELKPDIILLDIILPAIDGFQILSQIRANKDEAVSKIPIIMLSNLGQEDDISKAMENGANDYLVKAHFTTEEIVGKIKVILKK